MLFRLYYINLNKKNHSFLWQNVFVTKFCNLKSNRYSTLSIHKIKEYEAYLAILVTLPPNFSIIHIKVHQDKIKNFADLTTPEYLNVDVDKLTINNTKNLNLYPSSAKFVTYVNSD